MPYLSKTTKGATLLLWDVRKTIASVAYLTMTDSSGEPNLGFIHGKFKVAQTTGRTIPRLKLSAVVSEVQITQTTRRTPRHREILQ